MCRHAVFTNRHLRHCPSPPSPCDTAPHGAHRTRDPRANAILRSHEVRVLSDVSASSQADPWTVNYTTREDRRVAVILHITSAETRKGNHPTRDSVIGPDGELDSRDSAQRMLGRGHAHTASWKVSKKWQLAPAFARENSRTAFAAPQNDKCRRRSLSVTCGLTRFGASWTRSHGLGLVTEGAQTWGRSVRSACGSLESRSPRSGLPGVGLCLKRSLRRRATGCKGRNLARRRPFRRYA